MIGLDDALWPVFEEECYSGPGNVAMPAYVAAQNRTWVEKRNCISDEHYIPTLLAAKKQDAKVRRGGSQGRASRKGGGVGAPGTAVRARAGSWSQARRGDLRGPAAGGMGLC